MARSPGDQNLTDAERLRIRVLYAAGVPTSASRHSIGREPRRAGEDDGLGYGIGGERERVAK